MTPKPKTIVISRNAYTWQFGGAEQFTFNFAQGLATEGWRPVVITRVPELLEKCRQHGIPTFKNLWLVNETRRRWALAYYLGLPLLIGQYAYVMLRYRASLLIAGSRDDQMFGTLGANLVGRRAIWIDHADMKGVLASPFPFLRRTYLDSLGMASHVIAVSESEKNKIAQHIPKELEGKLIVINNGALRHQAEPRTAPAGARIISFIGRVEKNKGIYELIEAAGVVVKTHPQAKFWVVGKGTAEADIAKLITKSHLEKHVEMLGHLDDIGPVLAASELFVYPTHHDASPLAPVEALLAGVPVIASNVGGIPEQVDASCGILVKPGDASELAAAMNDLLSDPKRLAKLRTGATKRGSQFEFHTVLRQKYLPLINQAIDRD